MVEGKKNGWVAVTVSGFSAGDSAAEGTILQRTFLCFAIFAEYNAKKCIVEFELHNALQHHLGLRRLLRWMKRG